MIKVPPDTYTMLLMSLLSSADKLTVLLVLPEWLVLLRRGAGLVLAFGFGFATGLGFVTGGFGLLRVMVLCAAMPMGQSVRSRVRMMCLDVMICVSYASAELVNKLLTR